MSIMDIFRSAKPTPALETAAGGTQETSGSAPASPKQEGQDNQQQQGQQGPTNDLDKFKDLWTPPKEGEGPANFDPSKMFQIDPAKIQEEVSKINFAGALAPDTLSKIQAGGEDATQAFAQAMNSIAQQTFAQSMLASAKLVEGAMTQANNHLDSRIEQRAKQMQASNSLREANPALNHPAAAPIVSALEATFAQKHPTASPSELTKMAQDYLATFANVAAGKKEDPQAGKSNEPDWEAFFGNAN